MSEEKKGILLETGTGELEILEFVVSGINYAINVIKVKEILALENITKVPNTHPAVIGLTLVRGEVVTLINMNYVLENKEYDPKNARIILCEFNKMKVAFAVDSVVGIHRIGWDKIKKPDNITETSVVIGNIILGNKIIMMLDFEKIVVDISPSSGISEARIGKIEYKDRSNMKLVLADDSPLIRKLVNDVLTKAGYKNLLFFDDGEAAFMHLNALAQARGDKFIEDVQVLITDIEMPQMDGHTLTRKVKEHSILKKLPVVIFSSLITPELMHKGESVGANAQLSKPEIGELIEVIDELLSNKTQ